MDTVIRVNVTVMLRDRVGISIVRFKFSIRV